MAHWNPQTYLSFGNERLRPALDLMAQIPLETLSHLVDLGCGPGNVTALLKERWATAEVLGIDSSSDMLEKAKSDHPDIQWQQADVSRWQATEKTDLIFSNACLHWLDNHQDLFPHLLNQLESKGVLAIQMPNNFAAPTHQLIRDVLGADHPLCPAFPVSRAQDYYGWLSDHCQNLNIWETTYMHVLDGDNPVADWTKGAALRPILDGLETEKEKQAFETEYRARIKMAYPQENDGKTVLPFKRLFIVAVKK